MSNPFLDRQAANGLNSHGRKSEVRMAKKLGAHLHRNSGASRSQKSDASLPTSRFRLEAKSTTKDALLLPLGWLVKISLEALPHGQRPAVVLSFVDAEGKPRAHLNHEWVVISLATFKELTDE